MRNWMKELRKSRKLTQKELAEIVNVSRTLITEIENGKADPSVKTAKAIAKELEFDWTEFFKEAKHSA